MSNVYRCVSFQLCLTEFNPASFRSEAAPGPLGATFTTASWAQGLTEGGREYTVPHSTNFQSQPGKAVTSFLERLKE